MRAVVQRVKNARVDVAGQTTGAIGVGLLVYLGVADGDTSADLDYMVGKLLGLRIFADENGNMNRAVHDVQGQILVVSQFTLMGDVRKGRRPSFGAAMEPVAANELYEQFVQAVRGNGVSCETGVFRAMMDVHSVNDGPVTILLDSKKLF